MKLTLRPETISDKAAIYELIQLAFEQEEESKLVDRLREDESYIPDLSLVAVLEAQIVGYILFTKIVIQNDQGVAHPSLAIAPMAVLPAHQKQGIGGLLIRMGLASAKDLGYTSVIVLGHKDYYSRFGFVPAEKWNIQTHYEVPSEYFMALELKPNGLASVSGMVKYAKPFEML